MAQQPLVSQGFLIAVKSAISGIGLSGNLY
jgi:hypothetical protein